MACQLSVSHVNSYSTKWKSLSNRRLQNWGGVVHEKGLLPQQLPPWLSDLTGRICEDVGLYPSPINHVLINEYHPGQGIMPHQDGPAYFPVVTILSLGSPAVMEFTAHTKLLESTGSTSSSLPQKAASVVLMPGSLLIFKDSAYQDYLHGISESMEHIVDRTVVNMDKANLQNGEAIGVQSPADVQGSSMLCDELESCRGDAIGVVKRTGTRISLTCRLVPKVRRNLFKF
ncbi:hypothetical protein KP509_28G031100 [Ceratopteris richardii]|uniref:Fe2OG dioxygenase domain-containing protein n=1 Tax=Ceratopteris richardii TaxID=49495 RepID=A0A8T2RDG1_CERRI|nr:hypothetical protein KP509_28G031100 [Ceratopteris richardii]